MIIHRDLWRVDSYEPQHQSHLCLPENNNFLSKRESSLVLYVFDHQRDDYSTWNLYDVTGLGMDIFVLPKLVMDAWIYYYQWKLVSDWIVNWNIKQNKKQKWKK